MGELEEKETSPTESQQQPQPDTEEPKETDKMLEKKDVDTAAAPPPPTSSPPVEKKKSPVATTKKSPTAEKQANGDEIINIPDTDAKSGANDEEEEVKQAEANPVTKEGREVKPKKIPIGGIKMPGFFMKAKPKGEGDGADGELLEKEGKEVPIVVAEEKAKKDEKRPCIGERIRNFFSRKPTEKKIVEDTKSENTPAEADDSAAPPPQKRGLLNAIKLPIANMIPKKKTEDDVELGSGPGTKAGLASMETLDDSLKDQDTVDKAPTKMSGSVEKLKGSQILKDEKSSESEEEKISIVDRLLSYRCSVDDALIALGIVLFVLLLGVIGYVLSQENLSAAPVREGRFIDAVTGCGMVEGLKEDGAFAFRGVPYALPPIGENRWKPAQMISSIDDCWNGTLKAHNATEVCSQVLGNGTVVGVEDCLTLDVITPHVRYDNPLPVIVLIGAESFTGGSPGILRPSARYARSRDVIFVRPNFRMGAFGFLALESLTKTAYPPTSGNYALTDIIAALNWVKLNIAHFGGDANSVTLFGHRAGATLVSALVTSRKVKDLYARAWVSSGSSIFPGKPLQESEKRNQEFMSSQCPDVNCLKDASTDEIWSATPDTWRSFPAELPTVDENSTTQHEWLVLDGDILQQHPADAWKEEVTGKPKLVIGTTAHESYNQKLRLKHTNWTAEEVREYVQNSKIGALNLTDEALSLYNATYEGLAAMISDIRTVCPLLTIARLQPSVPFYVVTQVDSQTGIADVDADVQAILGRYEPHTVEQRRYVSSIQQLFYHYVSHGEMPQYEQRRRVLKVEQDPLSMEDYPNCNFWISKDIVPRYARLD